MSSTPVLSGPTTPPIQAAPTPAPVEPTLEVGATPMQAPTKAIHEEGGASLVQHGQALETMTEPHSEEEGHRLPEGAQQLNGALQHDATAAQPSSQVCLEN